MLNTKRSSRMLLAVGAAAVAIVGGACAADDGGVSPGQEAPVEEYGTTDGYGTTGDDAGTTGTSEFGTTGDTTAG